jgi:solute carrier family 50 (sugar transporter)
MITTPVLLVFCIVAAVSAFSFHDTAHRKLLVGSIGLGISVALYGSPLVAMVSHFLLPRSKFITKKQRL